MRWLDDESMVVGSEMKSCEQDAKKLATLVLAHRVAALRVRSRLFSANRSNLRGGAQLLLYLMCKGR